MLVEMLKMVELPEVVADQDGRALATIVPAGAKSYEKLRGSCAGQANW